MNLFHHDEHIDLDLRKAILVALSVFLFFTLPILVINQITTNIQSQTEQTGRVAGASTQTEEIVKKDNKGSDNLILTLGILSTGISVILSAYFVISSTKKSK